MFSTGVKDWVSFGDVQTLLLQLGISLGPFFCWEPQSPKSLIRLEIPMKAEEENALTICKLFKFCFSYD